MATALETYLGSNELKKLIVERSFALEIPLKFICLDLGIDYKAFLSSYINSSENKSFEIAEEKFEAVLSALGIQVRHQFIIDKKFDHVKQRDRLREVFKSKNGTNN